ncbi:MAG: HTTM domain-containing protein, partial [Thermoanaerobaculia bacterium]|nr:HTTM domain-containing protein [Thermoanaerobaculia bacterium]
MSNVEVKVAGPADPAIQKDRGVTFTKLSKFGKRVPRWLDQPVSIAPLAVFRIVFGLLMLGSTIRFWALGWIEDHYIQSKVQFKYYGFEWVQLLPPAGMYALHVGMLLGALGIMLGYRYRWSALLFFLTFTYTELIDLTYYLNHYYFVSWVSLLLIFLPAHRYFSLDALRNPGMRRTETPRWTILILQFQLAVVYVFAGLAKINYAWLIDAMPLRIWLPANDTLPLIGPLLKWHYTPWLFSWAGMLYDCTIVFWLSYRRTRPWAYAAVIFFHVVTGLMFQIGVFPAVMIGATLIFFPAGWHEGVLEWVGRGMQWAPPPAPPPKGRGARPHFTNLSGFGVQKVN